MNARRRQHIGYGLLSLFAAYSLFLIIFYHVDIISGRLVAHAHYQHIGLEEHPASAPSSHTPDELSFLQQLSSITTFGTAIIIAFIFRRFDRVIEFLHYQDSSIPKSITSPYICLRAPPVLF